MATITGETTIAEARRLADESPHYVYRRPMVESPLTGELYVPPKCWYTAPREDDPSKLVGSCLFGQALINQGILPEQLEALEGEGIEDVFRALNIPFTIGEGEWCCAAQEAQDIGEYWGAAIATADEGGERNSF